MIKTDPYGRKVYSIPLVNDQRYVRVDCVDYERLIRYRWFLKCVGAMSYPARSVRRGGTVNTIYLHRAVLSGCSKGQDVHHKNGDVFNARRCNLELVDKRPHWGLQSDNRECDNIPF
jgi:hypothetical protein